MRDSYYDVIHAASTKTQPCIGWPGNQTCRSPVPKVGNRKRCLECRMSNDRNRKQVYDKGRAR